MKLSDISEGVAGPKNCWPGHRKVGTQPGTGKNAGKRVNKCKKIGEGLDNEVNPADVGEYDREGDMALGQLKTAEDAAAELRSILDADENLPEWVQAKITKAVDYLDTARDYMKGKEQGVAEGSEDRRRFIRHNIWTAMDSDEEVLQHTVEGDPFYSAKKFMRDLDDQGYDFTHVISPKGEITYSPQHDPRHLKNFPNQDVAEKAPEGWEGTVKAMKKHKDEVDNPWALAWYMKNKGYKSHKK